MRKGETYRKGSLSDNDQRTVDDGDGLSRALESLGLLSDQLNVGDHLRRGESSLNGLAAEGEAVVVHEIPLLELVAMTQRGALTDMKSLLLLFALQLRRPELFA